MSNQRVEQIRAYMKKEELDLVILGLSENVVLVSESYWPRNGLAFVVIAQKGFPVLLIPKPEYPDVAGAKEFEVRTFGSVKLSEGNAYDNIAEQLWDCCKGWGISGKVKIGVELEPQFVAPALCDGEIILPGSLTMAAIRKVFDQAEMVNILPYIGQIRKNKLPNEQRRIHRVNQLARAGLDHFAEILDRGEPVSEIQLASQVEAYIAQNASKFHIRYARAWAQVSSGLNTEDAWNSGMVSGSRIIQKGDLVMLEMGTVGDGYFSDLTLTHVFGEPNEKKAVMLQAVKEAQEAAIHTVKAGVKAKDVDNAAREVLKKYKMDSWFVHGTGHGVGFAYHDGSPALNPSSEDILEEGMIHSVEPGVYIPEQGGVRFEVNVLVTKEGCVVMGE